MVVRWKASMALEVHDVWMTFSGKEKGRGIDVGPAEVEINEIV